MSSAFTVTVCSGPLRVSATAVRTATPSAPVATSQPLCTPRSSFAGSARSGTTTLPPAGTVTSVPPTATPSASALSVSRLRSSRANRRVCGAVPPLVYVTARSTAAPPVLSRPKSAVAEPYTRWPSARATSTRPAPCSKTVNAGFAFVVLTSASLSFAAAQSGCSWARIAAAPATCGVAIEVPDAVV